MQAAHKSRRGEKDTCFSSNSSALQSVCMTTVLGIQVDYYA
jgi:hypothetical protein